MTNKTHFVLVDALDTANHLIEVGFQELENCNENDDEPLKIIINQENKTFWFVDNACLDQAKKIKESLNEELTETTLNDIVLWKAK